MYSTFNSKLHHQSLQSLPQTPLPPSSVRTTQFIPRFLHKRHQTMHLQPLAISLALLTAANAALMLGTSSDSGTTYTWLHRSTLSAVFSSPVPGGGANFDHQGCKNQVPYNLPSYNDCNGARDATCALLSEGTHSCGESIGTTTTYGICDSGN